MILDWTEQMMKSSRSDTDPMWTVMREGGPEHCRGELRRYMDRIDGTPRAYGIPLLEEQYGTIRRKDYIENPKPNGYRSLHLIVEVPIFLQDEKRLMKVEVQLRKSGAGKTRPLRQGSEDDPGLDGADDEILQVGYGSHVDGRIGPGTVRAVL